MMRFRYKVEVGRKGELVWRPVADVWFLTREGQWVELHPYIDSGADVTLIPLSFGKLIRLETAGGRIERIGGISGSIGVVYHRIRVRIGTRSVLARVAWAQTEAVPALLGREDIFDTFSVHFKQRQKEIIFRA